MKDEDGVVAVLALVFASGVKRERGRARVLSSPMGAVFSGGNGTENPSLDRSLLKVLIPPIGPR